jgi:hypothetical protein
MARTEVDCIACHRHKLHPEDTAGVVGQTFSAVGESCTYCHGGKYETVLAEWKQNMAKMQETAESLYERVIALANSTQVPATTLRQVKNLLADADHNRRLVKLGHGVHNVNYATALLNAANEFCKKAEEILKQDRRGASQPGKP